AHRPQARPAGETGCFVPYPVPCCLRSLQPLQQSGHARTLQGYISAPMRIAQAFAAALTGLMLTGGAHAEQPAAGIVAPLSGPSELLGKQILTGATLAAGKQASLTDADDACTAEGGANAARMLVQAGVKVAI